VRWEGPWVSDSALTRVVCREVYNQRHERTQRRNEDNLVSLSDHVVPTSNMTVTALTTNLSNPACLSLCSLARISRLFFIQSTLEFINSQFYSRYVSDPPLVLSSASPYNASLWLIARLQQSTHAPPNIVLPSWLVLEFHVY
jgi:hypothetical protein